MNKQGSKANPNGGIEWTHILGPGTGFTANPVRGCLHDCKWRMGSVPDEAGTAAGAGGTLALPGRIVPCYAKAQRERLDGPGAFEKITFHPEVLDDIRKHKPPAGIFIDSMSDLFGLKVNPAWIAEVINTMTECPQHVFFTLTKNPRGLLNWSFPPNVLVGISAPPTFMYGKELSLEQQITWLDHGLRDLAQASAQWKWISIEPLSFNIAPLIEKYAGVLDWAVIGAGSDGGRTFQPDGGNFTRCLKALEHLPVFFKGNLCRQFVSKCGSTWRDGFPTGVGVRF